MAVVHTFCYYLFLLLPTPPIVSNRVIRNTFGENNRTILTIVESLSNMTLSQSFIACLS